MKLKKEEELFQKIFENEKIVGKISSYLTFWDICHSRESSKLFYRSFSSQLTLFNKKDIRESYSHKQQQSEIAILNLKSFVKFHEKSDNLSEYKDDPIAYQKFYLNFDLGSASRDSEEDLAVYSSFYDMLKKVKRIKYLRIKLEIGQFSKFVNLFDKLIIEELDITLSSEEIETQKNYQKSKVENLSSLKLQNVTKLNLRMDFYEEDKEELSPVAKSILVACSDLKELSFFCENFSNYEFDILSSLSMKNLKKIAFYEKNYYGFSESAQKLLINFAQKFKSVQIGLDCYIFEVENLKWNEINSFFDLINPENIKDLDDNNLPVFPFVEKLKLKIIIKSWDNDINNELFYLSLVQCLKIFPILKHLGINVNNSGNEESFKKLADDGISFPSLKELDIFYFDPRIHSFPILVPSPPPTVADADENDDNYFFLEDIEGQGQEGQEEENEDEFDNNYQPGQEEDQDQNEEEEEDEVQPDLDENEGQEQEVLHFLEDDQQGLEEEEQIDDNNENETSSSFYLQPSDLSKVYSNLIDLKLTRIWPRMNFEEIWKNFPKLEHFTFSPDYRSYTNYYKMTDENITGINQEYINQNLKGKSCQELINIRNEDFLTKIGIWNMKKLKTLKLSCHEKHSISELSFLFGFRLLPNLEVLDIPNIEVTPNVRELLLDENEFINLKHLNAKYPAISKFGRKEIEHKLQCKVSPHIHPNFLTEKEPIFDEKWNEKVFGEDLLSKIGEFLPLKSALILRRVSKFWCKHIFSNKKNSIHFDLWNNGIGLEHFMEFYENSKLQAKAFYSINFGKLDNKMENWPINPFTIPFEQQLQCFEKILKIFSLGRLSFDGNNLVGDGYLRVFSIIQENAVNLEGLNIFDYGHYPINQTLPILKSVQKLELMIFNDNIFMILIESCPNIKSLIIQNYTETILDRLVERASELKNIKILTLKYLKNSNNFTEEIYAKIIRVAEAFKLEKIILLHMKLEVKEGLNCTNIEAFFNLISSQDETLDINIPVIPEVTSFSQSEKIIKNFSRIFYYFPNLTELALKFEDESSDNNFLLEKINENEDFSKLEILEYNFYSSFWLTYEEKICNYFPNLTQLSIKFFLDESINENKFKFNLALIYEGLPKLTKLALNLIFDYYSDDPYMEKIFVSDEEITGIPLKYIQKHLLGKAKDEEFFKNLDPKNIPGKKTGIEALKDLNYFEMNFEGMTSISIWLGFRKLPKLKSLINEHLIIDLSTLDLIENKFSELEELNVNFSKFSEKRYSIFKERCPLIRTSKDFGI